MTGLLLLASACGVAAADPTLYEAGSDPGVGFNFVSWSNFAGGAQVWENAVQSAFDAGFDEVSLSPVRYYTIGSGSIAATSSQGPELSHVAAGVARAKSLGMRVTVNPFIEPVNFTEWRGFYNPAPGSAESNTFWSDYQQYLVDTAVMAEASGADSMTVGTELRALVRNSGNNARWDSVISAVDSAFSGSLGYAANWDNYNHANAAAAIWDNPAIDFIGIDSYFQNVVSAGQASQSGDYPDPNFIATVESAWNNKLDNEILAYASARQSGAGLPVVFTEVGYLPYDQTTATPQRDDIDPFTPGRQPPPLDPDEQTMAFEGLMRALDGRLASGEFLAAHVWQWDMPGSAGSLWNMNPAGGNQPNNQQAAQWLSSFARGTNNDPGDPDPDPDPAATRVLYSFENGLDGFFYPNFESEPASTLQSVTGVGATHGERALRITKPTEAWTWDARVQMTGEQLTALQAALSDNPDDYLLEIDVTYSASDAPTGLSFLDMHVSLDTNLDGWSQVNSTAPISAPTNQTITVELPLTAFTLTPGIGSAALHLGFAGDWTGAQSLSVFVDRIALTDTTFVPAENPDFNNDGVVDAADYTVWRDSLGATGEGLAADGNHDLVVDALDYELWRVNYGVVTVAAPQGIAPAEIPEPAASVVGCCLAAALLGRARRR